MEDDTITVDDFIEMLQMACPCFDPECQGAWLTRHEATELITLLRETKVVD